MLCPLCGKTANRFGTKPRGDGCPAASVDLRYGIGRLLLATTAET